MHKSVCVRLLTHIMYDWMQCVPVNHKETVPMASVHALQLRQELLVMLQYIQITAHLQVMVEDVRKIYAMRWLKSLVSVLVAAHSVLDLCVSSE